MQIVDRKATSITFYSTDTTKATLDLSSAQASLHPTRYELRIPQLRTNYKYGMFEPFVRDYARDFEGIPVDTRNGRRMWDNVKKEWINGYGPHDLIPIRYTYFHPGTQPMSPINREDPLDVSIRSKIPTMTINFAGFGDNLPTEIEHIGFRFGRDSRNAQENGLTFARLESVQLIHPSEILGELQVRYDDRRVSGPVTTKVIATGISRSGIRTTVETYLVENDIPDLGANAALMSQNGVTFNAHTNIRWGEILTYGDHVLDSPWRNHYPKYPSDGNFRSQGNTVWDPWFAHRITASPQNWGTSVYFKDGGGNFLDGSRNQGPFHSTPPTFGTKQYYRPLGKDTLRPNYSNQSGRL